MTFSISPDGANQHGDAGPPNSGEVKLSVPDLEIEAVAALPYPDRLGRYGS
jgi:hypothetical protein